MLFELIAVVVVGVAAAGIAMILRILSRQRAPRWIVPVFAGLGMIGYTLWSEYSWFTRLTEQLPPEVEIAWKNADTAFWQPWSYLIPITNRFAAVDLRTVQSNARFPDQVIVDVILAARWQPSARVKVLFDCAGHRRADLIGSDVVVAENGEVTGASWVTLSPDEPIHLIACAARS